MEALLALAGISIIAAVVWFWIRKQSQDNVSDRPDLSIPSSVFTFKAWNLPQLPEDDFDPQNLDHLKAFWMMLHHKRQHPRLRFRVTSNDYSSVFEMMLVTLAAQSIDPTIRRLVDDDMKILLRGHKVVKISEPIYSRQNFTEERKRLLKNPRPTPVDPGWIKVKAENQIVNTDVVVDVDFATSVEKSLAYPIATAKHWHRAQAGGTRK